MALLFLTGLRSMGMEVVWVREFTPYLGTVVYAFAGILCVYLAATFIGSRVYRRRSSRLGDSVGESPLLRTLLGVAALLPLLMSSRISRFLKRCGAARCDGSCGTGARCGTNEHRACCLSCPVPSGPGSERSGTLEDSHSQLLDGPGDLFMGDDGGRRKEQVVAGDSVDAALHGINEEAALEGSGGDASSEVLGGRERALAGLVGYELYGPE